MDMEKTQNIYNPPSCMNKIGSKKKLWYSMLTSQDSLQMKKFYQGNMHKEGRSLVVSRDKGYSGRTEARTQAWD